MSLILPYKKEILRGNGCFIKPNCEIMYLSHTHERAAYDYCKGPDYSYLCRLRSDLDNKHINEIFESYKEFVGYTGKREDIDIYSSSKLSEGELRLFKLWESKEYNSHQYSDFMILVLGWDKLNTLRRVVFTTTCDDYYTRFYNYLLMECDIDHQTRKIYYEQTQNFEWDGRYYYINRKKDRKVEEEIKKIRSEVPINERHLFFR